MVIPLTGTRHGDQGLYILWLQVKSPTQAKIGKLGTLYFPPGLYAYVGSAQRHRSARVGRHLKLDKPKRWHIDYLRPYSTVVSVSYRDGDQQAECALVQELIDVHHARRAHPRFGASDCRCGGHLLLFPSEHKPFDLTDQPHHGKK